MCTQTITRKKRSYVGHLETSGEAGAVALKKSWQNWSGSFAELKLGKLATPTKKKTDTAGPKTPPTKTYQLAMELNNMLLGINHKLADYIIRVNADGACTEPDPFKWKGLNLALDRGSDCVCLDRYSRYKKNANVSTDDDPSHDGKILGGGH